MWSFELRTFSRDARLVSGWKTKHTPTRPLSHPSNYHQQNYQQQNYQKHQHQLLSIMHTQATLIITVSG